MNNTKFTPYYTHTVYDRLLANSLTSIPLLSSSHFTLL